MASRAFATRSHSVLLRDLLLGVGLASATIVWAPAVHAQQDGAPAGQEPAAPAPQISAADRARAEELLLAGRIQMAEKDKLAAGCETLATSYALHNRGDTLLNLAECHRRQGKTATAWREFDEAIRYAQEVEFKEAIDAAIKLRDELATKLSGLEVKVPTQPAPPAGLIVRLDGKLLPSQQWDQPLFVDPGPHTVEAIAKGFKPFTSTVDVKKDGARATLTVILEKEPEPSRPKPADKPPPPKPPPVAESEVPVWAIVVGSAGIAMMGVSVVFGVDTLGVGGDLDDACGTERKACPSDYDFVADHDQEVRSYGLFVGFGAVGVVATGVGIAGLIVGLNDDSEPKVGVLPWIGPDVAGMTVGGRF